MRPRRSSSLSGFLRRAGAAFLLAALLPADGAGDQALELRREYNAVAASIDTLVRLHGSQRLERLTALGAGPGVVPAGFDVVLIFWADDEAEVYLNGLQVSETRLTPVEVVIPAFYLQERNVLRAHCWDTDRVESGFMAGVYLRDRAGRLRRVLVTEEGRWLSEGRLAEERFYSHPQPDIPGARVLWGDGLFGEVWLETQIDAAMLRQAGHRAPLRAAALQPDVRAMDLHAVVSRLVSLQERRDQLSQNLAARGFTSVPVRYHGYLTGQLAFTLGRAGPLSEARSIDVSRRLQAWADSLPEVRSSLVYRDPRELKGVSAVIAREELPGSEGGDADRRSDYVPPPERGPVVGGAAQGVVAVASAAAPPSGARRWGLLTVCLALGGYVTAGGRQWWRVYNGKVW